MTSVKIINDDVGLRRLIESNKTPAISGPVMPVKASNPVQKSPENTVTNKNLATHSRHQPHHSERRQSERRKNNSHVLLETRSQHDRRTKTIKTDENDNIETVHGIDEIV